MHCTGAGTVDQLSQRMGTSVNLIGVLGSGLVQARKQAIFHASETPGFGLSEIRCLDFQRTGIYSVTRPYCADSAYVIAEILRHQALSAEHCVDSVFLHQLVVSALFHHLSLIQNVDSIGISHG